MPHGEKNTKERCDRCGRMIRNGRGYYRGACWDAHLRPGENFVCWDCLDADPYFQEMTSPIASDTWQEWGD